MPNAPAENTVATSFTLPRELLKAIEQKARMEMTSKSDLIRRALMNYLTTEERASVLKEMRGRTGSGPRTAPEKKVIYRKSKAENSSKPA